ncbi:inactive lysozyme 1A-like [Stomoxys calcitrans]|uniref:inactive lysozyme 1A-like n=1 Tax=Stomoxys calcitrans TaxID=35570 RepID=UPI0027E2D17E|nr:inactive lysozyme 1A-like [Stomoxys calcitrans]
MDRCSLAKEMYAMGVPKSDLPMWTCIAEHESHYNTDIVGPTNKDGTNDYGIFQINNRWWCKPSNGGKTANGCKINCNDLLGNLRKSINCALTVKKEQGWKAWATLKFCGGKLPSIDSCF